MIGIGEIPDHAIGEVDIEEAVAIVVGKKRGPRPVGGREMTLEGRLGHFSKAGIQKKRVAHCLARKRMVEDMSVDRSQRAHGDLGFVVGGSCHIKGDEIIPTIVVEVASGRAHGEKGRVGNCVIGDLCEGAIAVVLPEVIGIAIVVGNVKIRPTVTVVIEPGGGECIAPFGESCFGGDIGKAEFSLSRVIPE